MIDIHTHILPPQIPNWKKQFGYGGFMQLEHQNSCCAKMLNDDGTFFRDVDSNCYEAAPRLKDCDKARVQIQVLSTVPVMFNYWAQPKDGLSTSQFLNDHIADVVAKNPERFVGLGTLPMQDTELAIQELERCVQDLDFPGVQIGSNINGKNLDDPSLFPIFQAAEKLNACVFIHPWQMLAPERMQKYWMPWLVGMPTEVTLAMCSFIFGGIFERLPRLKVAFAHGGGSFAGTWGRIKHGAKARPDLCLKDNPYAPEKYLGRFFVDSLVHESVALKNTVQLFGENQVMLGTDYPFPLGEEQPGRLITESGFSQAVRQKLKSENAQVWLGRTFDGV
jgi:aminocarboxymuconate-semialdehyde decarboxylase